MTDTRWRALVVDADASMGMALLERRPDLTITDAGWMADAKGAVIAAAHDIVITERQLPDGDGLELVRWLRGTMHLTLPIIVLDDHLDDDRRRDAHASGATVCLPRTAGAQQVAVRCERLLGLAPARGRAPIDDRRRPTRFNRHRKMTDAAAVPSDPAPPEHDSALDALASQLAVVRDELEQLREQLAVRSTKRRVRLADRSASWRYRGQR